MKKYIGSRAIVAVVLGLCASIAYATGVLSPEAAILGGMLPMAMGDTDFGDLKELLKKQGTAFE